MAQHRSSSTALRLTTLLPSSSSTAAPKPVMVDTAYWHSAAVTAHANDVNKMLSYLSIGFFFYDVLLSLPYDVQLFTGKRKFRWVHVAYFGTKLAFFGFIGVLLSILWAQREIDCQAAFIVLETFMGLTVFASSALLAFRTLCVFHGRERIAVQVIIAVMALGMLAAWMQGVDDVVAAWDVSPGFAPYTTGRCNWLEVKHNYWIKYVITIIFDATILGLTTFGIARMAGTSRLGLRLIHQGIIYFVLTFAANLIIAILTLLSLSPSMSLLAAVPQSAICVISSCRLHRHLADIKKDASQPAVVMVACDADGNVLPVTTSKRRPLMGRMSSLLKLGGDMVVVDKLSYSRGTVPSYVSGSTAVAGSSSSDGKSIAPMTPFEVAAANARASAGYFDRAPVRARSTDEEMCFEDMFREHRRRSNAAPAVPSPITDALTRPSAITASPSTVSMSIEQEQEQEQQDDHEKPQ